MKKAIVLGILLVLATPVFAKPHHTTVINNTYVTNNTVEDTARNQVGAKLDAPDLVRFDKDWTAGLEGGKNFNGTSSDEGWFTYAKVTYRGTWLNLNKGE